MEKRGPKPEVLYSGELERIKNLRENLRSLELGTDEAKVELARVRRQIQDLELDLGKARLEDNQVIANSCVFEINRLQKSVELFEEEIRTREAQHAIVRSEMHRLVEQSHRLRDFLSRETEGQQPN